MALKYMQKHSILFRNCICVYIYAYICIFISYHVNLLPTEKPKKGKKNLLEILQDTSVL